MRKSIHLTKANHLQNTLQLMSEEIVSLKELKALGQVIVDSNQIAFVYLTEGQDEYTYLNIPENVWQDLHEAIHNQKKIVVVSDEEQLELINIHEELTYLISNIEGNSNYGDEMVSKVEKIFLSSNIVRENV